jgi:UDP-N-acetylmuramyl pentapeptide phosphotransferase/UDP-N-acetylglucosamine-1-phosphate transferase
MSIELIYILSFFTALVITYLSVPAIINLAKIKKLYDEPNHRKAHLVRIPTLGGLALFIGFFFSFVFWTSEMNVPNFGSILSALIILFVIGIKDDLFPLVAWKKLLAQIMATLIVVIQGDIRIDNLYGLMGVHDMSYWISVVFSTVGILAVMNGFNLIDGINGLAAGIGVIVLGTFAYWFYRMEDVVFLILCLTLIGSLLAFLRFNFKNASIFMGDSGSLVLGYLIAIIAVRFVQLSRVYEPNYFFSIAGAVYAFNLLIIPLFDTFRVFIVRLLKRRSPFSADRNHIHHCLLDLGMTHSQAAMTLYAANLLFIGLAWMFQSLRPVQMLLLSLLVAAVLSQIPFFLKRWQKARQVYRPEAKRD